MLIAGLIIAGFSQLLSQQLSSRVNNEEQLQNIYSINESAHKFSGGQWAEVHTGMYLYLYLTQITIMRYFIEPYRKVS